MSTLFYFFVNFFPSVSQKDVLKSVHSLYWYQFYSKLKVLSAMRALLFNDVVMYQSDIKCIDRAALRYRHLYNINTGAIVTL